MRLILEVISGEDSGRRIIIHPGQVVRVGRYATGNHVVLHDPMVSNAHFVIEWNEQECRLRDLNSRHGTRVNGAEVTEVALQNGDRILVGDTTIVAHVEGAVVEATPAPPVVSPAPAPPAPPPAPPPVEKPVVEKPPPTEDGLPARLVQVLRRQPGQLFALLDAARDPKVLALLRSCRDEVQSLYEGPKGETLADFAPYLVRLPESSPVLEQLAADGWGQSWGLFLTTDRPFAEVRKHFRRFLLVRLPDQRPVYFRFYDPRVLRVFLPTCNAQEAKEFMDGVGSFLIEAEQPTAVLRFTLDAKSKLHQDALTV